MELNMRLSLLTALIFLSACATCEIETRIAPDLKFEGIELETSSFDDVYAKFGVNPIRHEGDAGDSRYFNCYKSAGQYVEFESNAEMAGGVKISQIRLETNNAKAKFKDCRASKVPFSKFANGIGLGTPVKFVAMSLGEPDEILEKRFTYHFSKDVGGGFTESTTLVVSFDAKNEVESIRAARVTSN